MSRSRSPDALRSASPIILPSLLLCDFGHLADELSRLEAAGIDAFHLDVMDGHFVPNLTYGLTIVETVRRLTRATLDVHLMISNPDEYLRRYYDAGADVITVHAEALERPAETLARIGQLGAAAGLAINPPTPIEQIEDCLDHCDLVLVMSVMPGFGGQPFDETALSKLAALRKRVGPQTVLEVDGGVNRQTIVRCAAAGADWFVVGSGIFSHDDDGAQVSGLLELARTGQQKGSP